MDTNFNRNLLIQDVMGRLPYHPSFELDCIVGHINHIYILPRYNGNEICDYICEIDFFGDGNYIDIKYFKPLLVPMESMDEAQRIIYGDLVYSVISSMPDDVQKNIDELYDWLNKNDFDYRGLIGKGLAINKYKYYE